MKNYSLILIKNTESACVTANCAAEKRSFIIGSKNGKKASQILSDISPILVIVINLLFLLTSLLVRISINKGIISCEYWVKFVLASLTIEFKTNNAALRSEDSLSDFKAKTTYSKILGRIGMKLCWISKVFNKFQHWYKQ